MAYDDAVKAMLNANAPPTARAAFAVARGVARVSELWGHRGLGTLYKHLGRLPLLGGASGRVESLPGAVFETSLFEPYWAPTIVGGRPYEPELMAVFRRFQAFAPTLVDCGANYGFWSIVATATELRFPRAVAIEANPSTFALLESNCQLNDWRFSRVHRAISDTVGETVALGHAESHANAHISVDGSGAKVLTTTIDTVIDELGWRKFDNFVLKVDVEGHEVPAIRGASRLTSNRDHVWVLEDFERTGLKTLEHVLNAGYAAYYVDRKQRCWSVRTARDAIACLQREKLPGRARNFVAAQPDGAFRKTLDDWANDATPCRTFPARNP